MAYNVNPATTQMRVDFLPNPLERQVYVLPVVSYDDGRDIAIEVERNGVRTELSRNQMSVEAISGGGIRCRLLDDSGVFELGDNLIATRSSPTDDPSSYPRTGLAQAGAVRASMQRLFALIQERVAGGTAGVADPVATDIHRAVFTPQRVMADTQVQAGGANRYFLESRIFTGDPGDTLTSITPTGIRIDVTGFYSLDLQAVVQIQNVGHSGEWGVSLIRANGLTGADEVIHQSSIFSAHTESVAVGATEEYIEELQFPISKFNEGDHLYLALSFGHDDTGQSHIFRAVVLGEQPGPAPDTRLTIRRYTQVPAPSQSGTLDRPQVLSIVTNAINGITPKFTAALEARLNAARTAAEVQSAIDTALDGIDVDIRRVVDGNFVIGLIDAQEGNTDWRTRTAVDVAVDGNQMAGDGSPTNPIGIITGGIVAGLLAANAVATTNIEDEAVTLDKLSAVLQGNWRNMLRSVREIEVTGGTATATRVDGTTFTFSVGTGMGGDGGGALVIFSEDSDGNVTREGAFGEVQLSGMSVVPNAAGDRATIAPDFPPQVQTDWNATTGIASIANRPDVVEVFRDTRPEPDSLTDGHFYAWAGPPDAEGGLGLYRAVPNAETPLNVVNATFGDSAAQQAAQALQAGVTSQTNHFLLGFGMNLSASTNRVFLWLRDDAPAAATLYAAFNTQDAGGDFGGFGSTIEFTLDDSRAVPAGLVRPSGARQYTALAGFPVNWSGGYGRRTQVRITTDAGGATPYLLKRRQVVEWVDDPDTIKHYLEGLKPGDRLSTHFLDDGAVARLSETDPTDFSVLKEGELVLVLTQPPALKVVTGNYDQPEPTPNRFVATTDAQGFASAAANGFEGNESRNMFSLRAIGGTGTAQAQGSFTLYLDAGASPPATLIARSLNTAFPSFDGSGGTPSGTVLTRITGHQGTVDVGSRTYTGYVGRWVSQNPHLLDSATLTYDLYTSYTDKDTNTPFNVRPSTRHVPGALVNVSAAAVEPAVPSGGWTRAQVNSENRDAQYLTVDASGFSGVLRPADNTVQRALDRMDSSGGLDASGADARIRALVDPIALRGNTDEWPADKVEVDGVDASALTSAGASPPALTTETAGRIEDFDGTLWVVVPDTKDQNVLRGVAAAQSNNYRGTAAFQWYTIPGGAQPIWQAFLPRSVLGGSPPQRISFRFIGDTWAEDVMSRYATGDTPANYAYRSARTGTTTETAVGSKFQVQLFSGATSDGGGGFEPDFTTPLVVHSGLRWEQLLDVESDEPDFRSDVYQQVKRIIVGGQNIDATPSDTDETVTVDGQAAGTGSSGITAQSDGTTLGAASTVTTLDFAAGLTATRTGDRVTVNADPVTGGGNGDGGGGGAGAANPLGMLWAVSNPLPTAAGTWATAGAVVNPGTTPDAQGWTIQAGVPTGVGRWAGYMNISADVPEAKPQVQGLCLIAKIGTEEQGRIYLPWTPTAINYEDKSITNRGADGSYSWMETKLTMKKYSGGAATDARMLTVDYGVFEPNGLHIIGLRADRTRVGGSFRSNVPDANTTIEVYEWVDSGGGGGADAPTSGAALPAVPWSDGQRRVLTAQVAQAGVGVLTAASSGGLTGWRTGLGSITPEPVGVAGVYFNSNTQGSAALRGRLVVERPGTVATTWDDIVIVAADGSETSYALEAAPGLAHFYRTTRTWTDANAPFESGSRYGVKVTADDGTVAFAGDTIGIGSVIYTAATRRWHDEVLHEDDVEALMQPQALASNAEPWGLPKLGIRVMTAAQRNALSVADRARGIIFTSG